MRHCMATMPLVQHHKHRMPMNPPPPPLSQLLAATHGGGEGYVASLAAACPAPHRSPVFAQSVFSESVDLSDVWVPPVFPKSPDDARQLRSMLADHILFSAADAEALQQLVDCMQVNHYSAGQHIIQQGDEGDFFYILQSGAAKVLKDGRKVHEYAAGGGFGELALLHGAPRAASVVATQDSTAWAMDRVTFKRVIATTAVHRQERVMGFLRQSRALRGLSEHELRSLVDVLQEVPFQAGAHAIQEGNTDTSHFYIVHTGEFAGTKAGVQGEVCPRLGPGDCFGERGLLLHEARAATITATRDSSAFSLARGDFVRLLGPLRGELMSRLSVYDASPQGAGGGTISPSGERRPRAQN